MKTFLNFLKWVGIVLACFLVMALIIPPGYKVVSGVWRWGFSQKEETQEIVCPECPVCPDCVCGETSGNTGAIIPPTTDYVCNVVKVGGPVETAGQCSFCTVNYEKPGDVFVAGKEPIQYEAGAWVFQYNSTEDIDEYKGCINGQDMVTDPSLGYNIVWH